MLYVGFHAIYHGDSSSYLDVPKLILERVSCKQTMQTAPLETWKSEPVFRRRARRRKNLVRNETIRFQDKIDRSPILKVNTWRNLSSKYCTIRRVFTACDHVLPNAAVTWLPSSSSGSTSAPSTSWKPSFPLEVPAPMKRVVIWLVTTT